MKGKLIVIEGVEGAGKSSQIKTIKDSLISLGISPDDIVLTREPGGTPFAEEIRALALTNREETVDPMTELYLMFASRQQHVTQKIKPLLEEGKFVICDRFLLSTYGYQGYGRGIDLSLIKTLSQNVLGQIVPDLTLMLDIDPAVGLQRACSTGEPDRIEKSKLSFFDKVREGMKLSLDEVTKIGVVIDAGKSLEEVTAEVSNSIKKWADRSLTLTSYPMPDAP